MCPRVCHSQLNWYIHTSFFKIWIYDHTLDINILPHETSLYLDAVAID